MYTHRKKTTGKLVALCALALVAGVAAAAVTGTYRFNDGATVSYTLTKLSDGSVRFSGNSGNATFVQGNLYCARRAGGTAFNSTSAPRGFDTRLSRGDYLYCYGGIFAYINRPGTNGWFYTALMTY